MSVGNVEQTQTIIAEREGVHARENGQVRTFQEAVMLVYRELLLPYYAYNEASLDKALEESTCEDLLRKHGIDGANQTYIPDIDGVLNNNSVMSILRLKLEDADLEVLKGFITNLHKANFIIFTSRPVSWNWTDWVAKIYEALGVDNGRALPLSKDTLKVLTELCN